jgi:hypothetical protein
MNDHITEVTGNVARPTILKSHIGCIDLLKQYAYANNTAIMSPIRAKTNQFILLHKIVTADFRLRKLYDIEWCFLHVPYMYPRNPSAKSRYTKSPLRIVLHPGRSLTPQ